MPIKTEFVTSDLLRFAALPNHGKRYAVIPHGHIIDETRKELSAAGFTIKKELYKTTLDAQVAQGIYHLDYGNDSDMGLMFAWSNSYNKMMRFKCAIGAQVFICMNGVVSGDIGNYKRKHTGTALSDATTTIQHQISNAKLYYDNLVEDKEMLKNVYLTRKQQGAIIGELYADLGVLTLTQVGIVKRELDKPTYYYSGNPDSAWDLYNHVTTALKESHPLTYLSDHQIVHGFFVDEFGTLIKTPTFVQQELPMVIEDTVEETVDFGVSFM